MHVLVVRQVRGLEACVSGGKFTYLTRAATQVGGHGWCYPLSHFISYHPFFPT